MHILLVTLFYPPRRNAGTEQYTQGVARALRNRGHQVQVVCAGDWDSGAEYWNGVASETHEGVSVRRVNLNWTKAEDPNRVLYDSAVVGAWFEGLLLDTNPDVVHVTSAATLGVGVLQVSRRLGFPLVLTLMDFWFLCPRTVLTRGDGRLCEGDTTPWDCQQCLLTSSNLYRRVRHWLPARLEPLVWGTAIEVPWLARARGLRGMALDMADRKSAMRLALTCPDVILSHSRFVRDTFVAVGTIDRIEHLPNGHDLAWLERYEGKTDAPVVRVGYLGQITHTKGVHVLIDAFLRSEAGDRARLDIWGDTSREDGYVRSLQASIGRNPAIRLRGRYDRDCLASLLAEIDVLVVPSVWYENAPLVIQEAFATRTPVIATNLGGMAEAVTDGVNGLLFERNDADDLARQLRRVVNEPDLLESLSRGIPAVKTSDQEIRELEGIYERLVAQRRRAVHRTNQRPMEEQA